MVDLGEFEGHEERTAGFNLYVDLTKAILMRWDRVILELGLYQKYIYSGASGHIQNLASAIYELYMTIIDATEQDKDVNNKYIESILFSEDPKKYADYFSVFKILSDYLYRKKIIRPDGIQVYDSTRTEISNKYKGY